MTNKNDETDTTIEIEKLMQDIRQQLVANNKLKSLNDMGVSNFPVNGKALPHEFYSNLYYLATLLEDSIIEPDPLDIKIPLIGSVLTWFRSQIHSLVVYYVLKSNIKQAKLKATLFKTTILLVNQIEELSQRIETLELEKVKDE